MKQGGQEILYRFERYNLGMVINNHHKISFLYQPLEVVSEVTFKEDVIVDGVTFSAGTPMELSYGFPFYRITYGYDFFADDNIDLGAGAAFQLRNASIVFKQLDGAKMTVSQNLGPVPAVYLFGKYAFDSNFYLQTDITGLYASSAFINGANFDFEGSILDASLRAGYALKNNVDLFLNLRFLGGSAAGVSEYPDLYWTDSVEDATAKLSCNNFVNIRIYRQIITKSHTEEQPGSVFLLEMTTGLSFIPACFSWQSYQRLLQAAGLCPLLSAANTHSRQSGSFRLTIRP